MVDLSRRSFLKLTGSAAVLASVPSAVGRALTSYDRQIARALPLVEEAGAEGIRIFHKEFGIVVDANGCTVQELYSFLKEHWKSDSDAIAFPFPMVAVTPEYMEMKHDYEIDPAGWGNIQNGSIQLNEREHLMGMISLGPDDSVALNNQDFFAKVGNGELAPLGKAPINMPVLIDNEFPFSQLEIVDAKGRSYGSANDFGITDHFRSGAVRWPLFNPKDHTVLAGEDDFVHQVEAWQRMGNTKAEAYALTWPDVYEMPPNQIWGKYDGEPIRRKA